MWTLWLDVMLRFDIFINDMMKSRVREREKRTKYSVYYDKQTFAKNDLKKQTQNRIKYKIITLYVEP